MTNLQNATPDNKIKVNVNVNTYSLFETVSDGNNYNDIQSQENFCGIVEEELAIEFPCFDITCSRAGNNQVFVYGDDQAENAEIEKEVLAVLEKVSTDIYQNDWDNWTVTE